MVFNIKNIYVVYVVENCMEELCLLVCVCVCVCECLLINNMSGLNDVLITAQHNQLCWLVQQLSRQSIQHNYAYVVA